MKAIIKVLALCVCFGVAGCAVQKESGPLQAVLPAQSSLQTGKEPAVESMSAVTPGSSAMDVRPSSVTYDESFFEDYGDEQNLDISDPLEPWNRFWFSFNDFVLLRVVKPVYTGYEAVTPHEFRSGLSNALYNIQTPVRMVNRILQGEFAQAWVEFGRFVINSTVGFGGLIDVAKKDKPLVPMDEGGADFGQTLAKWGVGEGIYLVWPIVGPSTVRDTVGLAGDYAASPFFWLVEPTGEAVPFWAGLGTGTALRFNNIKGAIDAYEMLTKSAVEPYVAARDAYVKFRRATLLRTPAAQR